MKKTSEQTSAADDKRFWDVIAVGCKHDVEFEDFMGTWLAPLVEQVTTLPPELIVRFDRWFGDRTDALYTYDHWGAAYLINGGASDDGFYYWRCWLVGMGKAVYEAALKDPDSLAGLVDPDRDDYEAEIYGVARDAWQNLGLSEDDFDKAYKALSNRTSPKLGGRSWNFDDDKQIRKRFPRLAALYLDGREEFDDEDEDA
jgi:hypothetical protein